MLSKGFERYVNFDFYKTTSVVEWVPSAFERYVNFDFYKTEIKENFKKDKFERYVNFDFYKTYHRFLRSFYSLRDM